MNIKPLRGNLIVKGINNSKTESGIYIPGNYQSNVPMTGIIVSMGDPRQDRKGKEIRLNAKAGDKVHFKRYGFKKIRLHKEDEDVLLVKQEDVLGVESARD